MSELLSSVDQRTKLAGENRLELLLFQLRSNQLYGINVFKVREIIEYIPLTSIPRSHSVVRGIANMRGKTFPIFDLSMAIGYERFEDIKKCYIIVTEYNQTVQGFLVASVNRIVNLDWEAMHKPPPGSGTTNFLTAITNIEDSLVEIIDVEKILQEIHPIPTEVADEIKEDVAVQEAHGKKILICDDSRVARKQLQKTLEQIDIEVIVKNDGKEAYDYLQSLVADRDKLPSELLMLISDIEMPEMDGYKLTTEIRNDPKLSDLHVILHSSLSGVFNTALVQKVGADRFIAKFNPDVIVLGVTELLKKREEVAAKKVSSA